MSSPVPAAIRRLRRFPLPFDRSFWLYVRRLECVIQPGVGLPVQAQTTIGGQLVGYNPGLQIRVSPDYGKTWGKWITVGLGAQGRYNFRPVLSGVGKVRNGLCEMVCSDPVFATLLDTVIDVDENVT